MQLFCLVSKLQRMAEIFASLKMCKLPRCYSERQKPFLHLKFRDQKHSEQLYLSLLNLLYDTTDVFWRGMCWWEMLCWLAGARPGFSVARKQRNLWWVLWASVFWTSHQLSTMLLGAGGDLYLLLRIRELCQICLFFNSLSLASMSASFSVPNPPAHLLLDSLCPNQREAGTVGTDKLLHSM